ncbi:MAG: NAD-dependent DNA ligase LigA [Planctomycetaceae bacterium]|jgi:DNA ligase (NAD+)|nr:NAD-dependent DNA ligase LigA [Planctomycetaceae bacterium]
MSYAEEISRLRETIREHDRKYYILAKPKISDLEYDRLMQKLKELEAGHPELVTAESPTQRIGDKLAGDFETVLHRVPMLSIENTYSTGELLEFANRIQKNLPSEKIEWVVEPKIDGVAVSMIYENGLLVQGVTRGDGLKGELITHNVRTIRDVPLKLSGNHFPSLLEVRGEIYMGNSDFSRLNEHKTAAGATAYANTRNLVAGSIKQKDPKICAARPLRFFAHSVGSADGFTAENELDFLRELQDYGIPVVPLVHQSESMAEAIRYCEEVIENLYELDFEVDGLVLKVNRFDQREKLGSTAKSPRWVVAYKFEKYEAVTRLREIRVQVGKTGTITPVGELEPVQIAGTTVSRVSLHNAEEIQRKDIRVGDSVLVEKAGKIIPHVVRVECHLREKELPVYQFPTKCPECSTPLVQDGGGVYIRCVNPDCPAQLKERLRFFASRNAMDINGLGEKQIEKLVDSKAVTSFADLYHLTARQIERALYPAGERSAGTLLNDAEEEWAVEKEEEGTAGKKEKKYKSPDNLAAAIEESKHRGLARLLCAVSIRHVGAETAEILARHFKNIKALQTATPEELAGLNMIGEVVAKSIIDFFSGEFGRSLIAELEKAGVSMTLAPKDEPASEQIFAGKTVVVTGKLSRFKRDEIERLIKQYGGHATSSVSKKTDFLIAGEDAGSKRQKAAELGVKILTEEEFLSLLPETRENRLVREPG